PSRRFPDSRLRRRRGCSTPCVTLAPCRPPLHPPLPCPIRSRLPDLTTTRLPNRDDLDPEVFVLRPRRGTGCRRRPVRRLRPTISRSLHVTTAVAGPDRRALGSLAVCRRVAVRRRR